MKGLIAAVLLAATVGSASASPYLQWIGTKGAPLYFSQGVDLMPTSLVYDRSTTNLAVLYHPLSAGSIIPVELQPYIPPESWAFTIGGSYGSASGGAPGISLGFGINLLDSVRAYGATILNDLPYPTAHAIATQIAPGTGPLNIFASRQWDDTLTHPGRFAPRWFFGASFSFN